MLRSYVGLASQNGLEALFPEHALAVETLAARAKRQRSVCCWAVLSENEACEIDHRLASGEQAAALALLEAAAREVGQILPSDLATG